ncbi:MAG: hypothetical protein LBE91_15345 [Tannerella sp.]|nr:hypothetical protein [Tannerella sp.]
MKDFLTAGERSVVCGGKNRIQTPQVVDNAVMKIKPIRATRQKDERINRLPPRRERHSLPLLGAWLSASIPAGNIAR